MNFGQASSQGFGSGFIENRQSNQQRNGRNFNQPPRTEDFAYNNEQSFGRDNSFRQTKQSGFGQVENSTGFGTRNGYNAQASYVENPQRPRAVNRDEGFGSSAQGSSRQGGHDNSRQHGLILPNDRDRQSNEYRNNPNSTDTAPARRPNHDGPSFNQARRGAPARNENRPLNNGPRRPPHSSNMSQLMNLEGYPRPEFKKIGATPEEIEANEHIYTMCSFNPTHILLKIHMDEHMKTCPDKAAMTDLYTKVQQRYQN